VLNLGEHALTGVFPRSPTETVTRGELELLWCGSCTLVQLANSYDPEEMYGGDYGYRSGLNATMTAHLEGKAAGLEALVELRPSDVVLDIGSNDGTLLAAYNTPGLHLIGIDPTAARFSRLYPPGAEALSTFFTARAFESASAERARIITSIAMFYDVERPADFARDVASCLAEDGVWHFEQSYMPSMLRTTAYDTVCHEHVEYYSLATVQQILTEAELQIIDVRFNRVNGGSFAVTAAHTESPLRRQDVLVDWFISHEQRLALDTTAPFREFETRVFQHRADLAGLVRRVRQSGATVMALGASTKGNVLLQFCGFTPDDILAIGEVNEDKIGRVTPGTEIPIVSEVEVRAADPDYVMVLPWHFRESIINRESEYLRRGGRLIFPLPEIEIVGS
jgi:hypothetical protein